MRILIVDDDSLNRYVLLHMLNEQGYDDCYEADSGEQALVLAREVPPDLVLLDVMMPGLSGFEVAPLLKQMAGDVYLPVIFITALEDQQSLAKCLEVGGDDFASKPFDKVILSAKIRAHWRTRQLSQNNQQQNQQLRFYRARVEREHDIIRHIFDNVLAQKSDLAPLFDYQLQAAETFNGDLFICERGPSGSIYFLLGDFTGHGLASAIGAIPSTQAFRAMTAKGLAVAEIVTTLNDLLMGLMPADMFCAALVVEINANGQDLTIWNGGMPDLLVLSETGAITQRIAAQHMALGIIEKDEFDASVIHVKAQRGQRLVCFSDGAFEVCNENGQMLGVEGICAWLEAEPLIPMVDLVTKIKAYQQHQQQKDDITLISHRLRSLQVCAQNKALSPVPYQLTMTITPELMKSCSPIHELTYIFASQSGLESARSNLFTVLTELYNNALDHGILGLSSELKNDPESFYEYFETRQALLENLVHGEITIALDYEPALGQIRARVTDSGAGFDISTLSPDNIDDEQCHGRGVSLLYSLCQQVTYSDKGNQVEVILSLVPPQAA